MSSETENTNEEVSIIAHLIEIEKQASQIIAAANIKGDKKISEAKIAAENEFKNLYAEKAKKLLADFENEKLQILEAHNKIIDEYKHSVESRNQNKEDFNKLLASLLFEN